LHVKTLVIDVGGTNVKVLATGQKEPLKIPSGRHLTPAHMAREVLDAAKDWDFANVSIGFPGPVVKGRPAREPHNLGRGWMRFDYAKAFGKPVRIMNDAAMQALGSYDGGNMLFLGLGTGLGSAMVRDGVVVPLEIAHLPYKKDRTYEDYLGEAGMKKRGRRAWLKHVGDVVALFIGAFVVDYVVLGGGNTQRIEKLPPKARRGDNANAFTGGFRLWAG
jgi:predicted NBD/HSP70 family sugar kinase